ncbi:MAG: 50S ribosomal protein L9 [Dehalococcoidia bacterium]|nr:50S ribosomal protein L9 [Dehalococcoidia bacterium]
MKVLFVQDVPGKADAGEIKEVKNGYARNYLIPNNIAVPATEVQLQRINIIKKQAEERRIKEAQDMQLIADKLNGNEITITAKVGPTGKLYGSITNRNIADNLLSLVDYPVDHRSVLIAESIQTPGSYEATIRLHRDVSAVVTVNIVGEEDEALANIQAAVSAVEEESTEEAPAASTEEESTEEAPAASTEEESTEEAPAASTEEESTEEAPAASTEEEAPEK